ncbi:hypothetical protein [Shewanella sp. MF08487]|uniref:hypothetical protein n=1 Tax=Shewanella sp. MF08487 TaxID=3434873 RepID=UPI003D78C33C
MMCNWFTKMLSKDERPKRKKVLVEIPFEQHPFSLDDFSPTRLKYGADENVSSEGANPQCLEQEVDAGNK